MVGLPDDHVPRPRLRHRLAGADLVTIEAGGGFGKTTLVAERLRSHRGVRVLVDLARGDADASLLVLRLSRALNRAGLTNLCAALDSGGDPIDALDAFSDATGVFGDSILLAVDDVHHATGSAADGLLRLARSKPTNLALLLASRALPPALRSLARSGVHLDEDDLAFTVEETVALVGGSMDEEAARRLHRTTRGWPAALALSRSSIVSTGSPEAEQIRGINALVEEHLDQLDDQARSLAIQLAHMPVMDQAIVTALDRPELLAQFAATGLPLQQRGPGQHFLDPVSEVLRDMAALRPEVARVVAGVHAGRGEPLSGARILLAAGLPDDAAGIIEHLSAQQATELEVAELRTVVDLLPRAVLDHHPRAMLHLARALETTFETRARQALLDRLVSLAGDDLGSDISREVMAEVARVAVRHLDKARARSVAQAVLEATDPDDDVVLARTLDPLAWTYTFGDTDFVEAERLLRSAIEAARRTGVRIWVAEGLLSIAIFVQHPAGWLDRAEASLRESASLFGSRGPRMAVVLTFLADVLMDGGRVEESVAPAAEALEIGRSVGNHGAAAYGAWSLARAASLRGDAAGTVDALARAEQHRGEWFETTSGPTFLAQAACMLERTGEEELADRYRARAAARAAEAPSEVALAEVAAAVRRARRDAAEVLDHMADMDISAPLTRLHMDLFAAVHALDRADPGAPRRAADLFDAAAEMGHPVLPLTLEPDLGQQLIEVAVAAGNAAARAAQAMLPITVRTLGAFGVSRGGRPITLPAGTPSDLVKLLALRAPLDIVVARETLASQWPDRSPRPTGVDDALAVLDGVAPGLVVVDDTELRVGPGVRVDALVLETATTSTARLAATDRREALQAARVAVAQYRGDLLPDDRGVEWTVQPRERLRRGYLAAEDVVVAAAVADGDVDGAIVAVQRALKVDPDDEERHVMLARLYLRQGRRSRAVEAMERAREAAHAAGVPTSAHFRRTLRLLHQELEQPAPPPDAPRASPHGWHVRVLGGFEIFFRGVPVEVRPGLPRSLVALLVLAGGRMPVAQVLEELWPDVDEQPGRARLRELLARLRRDAPIVVRDGPEVLRLVGGTDTDLDAFEAAVAKVRPSLAHRAESARSALALYGGPLLPDHLHATWAVAARNGVRRGVLYLLDVLMEEAREQRDVAAVRTLADRILSEDPLDADRAMAAATALAALGDLHSARLMLDSTATAFANSDLSAPPGLEDLATTLVPDRLSRD